jgi:hypothetical protein
MRHFPGIRQEFDKSDQYIRWGDSTKKSDYSRTSLLRTPLRLSNAVLGGVLITEVKMNGNDQFGTEFGVLNREWKLTEFAL